MAAAGGLVEQMLERINNIRSKGVLGFICRAFAPYLLQLLRQWHELQDAVLAIGRIRAAIIDVMDPSCFDIVSKAIFIPR